MLSSYYKSNNKNFSLLHGDTIELLSQFNHKFDMIFADPPYFLSNGGLTIQSGKLISVNKGIWDKTSGIEKDDEFNKNWLSLVKNKMKDNATIWITGTKHNIFSIGQNLKKLGFKILNIITWEKTDPPPNFSHSCFNFSTEYIIWAKKDNNVKHFFNYELMKQLSNNKQMKDVWRLSAVAKWEKSCGKHPTQKPLSLMVRAILASTSYDNWILDPFTGSSTTGIAANLVNRKFLGIDSEEDYLKISIKRIQEIEKTEIKEYYKSKIKDIKVIKGITWHNKSYKQ